MSLGERIKQARGGMTQRDLADKLGVDPITVSRWERGVIELSVRRVRQIADATETPLEFFYSETAA
jgi:transcriptional regulator with XRE-family HTH domain